MTRLMSFCAMPMVAAKIAVVPPITTTTASAVGAYSNIGDSRAHHEHARRHHGRGMDQGRDRRRAFHRVGQPGVQAELRRFAHGADEQQQAVSGQRRHMHAEEVITLVPPSPAPRRTRCRNRSDAEQHEDGEDAEREAEIADPVDDEGLDRRGVGRRAGRTRSRSADRRQSPTPSQPKNICTKLLAVTSISMKKVNRLR